MNNIIATSAGADITPHAEAHQFLEDCDEVLIALSGGKDSIAMVLHIIELGYRHKIKLIHHDIDSGNPLFDWAVTPSYVRAFARHLDLQLIESGRVGGFKQELYKEDGLSGGYWWDDEDGHTVNLGKPRVNTRRRFPAISANLTSRWCSSFLKIDVCTVYIRAKYNNLEKVMVLTGERREESSNRAKYEEFEPDRAHAPTKRIAMRWRPVIDWDERAVWEIMRRHGINPHPAYKLGWGRLSCMCCIFGSKNQWASVRAIAPAQFEELAAMESDFDHTIHAKKTVTQLADAGEVYSEIQNQFVVQLATSEEYHGLISCEPHEWELPAGAYGESNGPS